MSKIIYIMGKKQTKILKRQKILFYFLMIKIKIYYIFKILKMLTSILIKYEFIYAHCYFLRDYAHCWCVCIYIYMG